MHETDWGDIKMRDNILSICKDLDIDKVHEPTDRYSHYDLYNDDYIIEHKARRCRHNLYDTIMFNMVKIHTFKREITKGKKCLIYYQFTDGLYKIECTLKNMKKFDMDQLGGRCDRGKCEIYQNKCYIPSSLLIPVERRVDSPKILSNTSTSSTENP